MKCRLCLFECIDENSVKLFRNNKEDDSKKLIFKYLFLQVEEDDPYSTSICKICLYHLEDFHHFFQHIEQRQKLLQVKLKAIIKDEPEELVLGVNDSIPEADNTVKNPLSPAKCSQDNLENQNNREILLQTKRTSNRVVQTLTMTTRASRTAQKIKMTKNQICSMVSDKTESEDANANTAAVKVEEPKQLKPIQTAEEEKLGDELIAKYIEMKCELCAAPMDTFKNLKFHTRKEHNAQGAVTCCGRRFRLRCRLLDHLQFHLNPDHFKCDLCNKVLKSRKLLELHNANKHSDRKKLKHACKLCQKRFASSSNLNAHMFVHSKERNHKCEICSKAFKSEKFLKVHLQTHRDTKPFVCETCGREYRNKMSFERHVGEHQGLLKEPTDKCLTCGKWFTSDGLQRHVRSHQLEDVECKLCGKVVKSKNALRGHMDYVHRNQQLFTCSFCEKTFKRPSVFKEHIAMHTGRKDFHCRHCSREFRSKANMYAHIKKKHIKEWTEAQLLRFKGPVQSQKSDVD